MNNDKPILVFQLKALNNQIKRIMERSAIEGNFANLTGMQHAVLGYIDRVSKSQDVYQRDMETEFNIRRSTASGILQLLEKEGLIIRESVAGDARLKKITLTEAAKEIVEVSKSNFIQIQARLVQGLTKEELDQFYEVLEKIQNNLKE